MFDFISFIVIIAICIFGLSYLAIIAFFLYYHNQLFNHVLYKTDTWKEPFNYPDVEELPDSIEIDDLI